MASNTEKERVKIREVFDEIDADGDGFVSHADLRKVAEALDYDATDDDIKELIASADKDGSGKVSFDEFYDATRRRPRKKRRASKLRRLFRALDTDNSGYITAANLREAAAELGATEDVTDEEIEQLIAEADTTGDGKISYKEFAAAIKELSSE